MNRKILKAKDACKLLNISLPHLYQLTQAKKIPHVRWEGFGKVSYRYFEQDLDAWLDSHYVEGSDS